jgi:D-alanyl-lipoteichoic acid acyltransferase DltB (MBOAT superfamily)
MLFNSLTFAIFLPVVFALYWFVFNHKISWRNTFILVASYVFYGWWDWRFLSLIVFSTLADFILGILLAKELPKHYKKILLGISLMVNLGLLGFFKYYNFFIDSWISIWEEFGVAMSASSLEIVLPVGISFYTFQTLSYTIDVYRERLEPTTNLTNFAAYVAFFPQLVAGPIERANRLLPQFNQNRNFDYRRGISGINLIIWGLFKKVVVADSCAIYADEIFGNTNNMNSASLVLGAIYFAFQIYGDFSGYSDIAIGTARLFGFSLMKNFDYPYFSRNIAEFWRRWHISLSTWFRDYLYIPLGGSRGSKPKQIRNVIIIFVVSGFWHGANWTFVVWGFLHALYYIPLLLAGRNRSFLDNINIKSYFPRFSEWWRIIVTFILVTVAWIFFRADSLSHAYQYILRMVTNLNFEISYLSIERYNIEMLGIIFILLLFEWFHRKREQPFVGRYKWIKMCAVITLMLTLGVYSDYKEFIYFQF